MPSKGKSKQKSVASPSSSLSSSKQNSKLQEPPAPFSRAPANLEPLLSNIDPEHVYITSIDNMPRDFKIKIFTVPLLMNIALLLYICWRGKNIGPYYLKIMASVMGYPNDTTVDKDSMSLKEINIEIAKRTFEFAWDLILYLVIWPWPSAFFWNSMDGSPLLWRVSTGFRDVEVTIRRSKKWAQAIGDIVGEGAGENTLFQRNVRQATSASWMHERTAYTMMNKEWDLDWRVMVLATVMVDKKDMSIDDFRTTVLVYSETFGWVVFEALNVSGSAKEEDGRKKILAFKNELTAMGKENVFFRWIELVQYESSKPGGFTPERQVEAMRKAKEMFESQGIDFDKFWQKVGGMEGMPGMELS